MAAKDGISVCSIDSNRESAKDASQQPDFDDDISSITLATDNNRFSMLCKYRRVFRLMHNVHNAHSHFVCLQTIRINRQMTNLTSISSIAAASLTLPKPLSNAFTVEANAKNETRGCVEENLKFAAITAAVSDILLDDETSPSNSLLSSTASDDVAPEKSKKKATESKNCEKELDDDEKDIDEISPIFDVATPASQGTPTHASNSFSFSDGDDGRDFLIDDEIADQPVLCFSDKNHGEQNI